MTKEEIDNLLNRVSQHEVWDDIVTKGVEVWGSFAVIVSHFPSTENN